MDINSVIIGVAGGIIGEEALCNISILHGFKCVLHESFVSVGNVMNIERGYKRSDRGSTGGVHIIYLHIKDAAQNIYRNIYRKEPAFRLVKVDRSIHNVLVPRKLSY